MAATTDEPIRTTTTCGGIGGAVLSLLATQRVNGSKFREDYLGLDEVKISAGVNAPANRRLS